jgi:hypothetical protein
MLYPSLLRHPARGEGATVRTTWRQRPRAVRRMFGQHLITTVIERQWSSHLGGFE